MFQNMSVSKHTCYYKVLKVKQLTLFRYFLFAHIFSRKNFENSQECYSMWQRNVLVRELFRERINKVAYHQMLQNMHVSDREDRFRFIIT